MGKLGEGLTGKRTIIIDDEADNASIGYSKAGDLFKARTIAAQISELRSSITNASFLQVTATPYSLYLQPSEIEVANVMAFKPTRPAFTKLVPVPAEYVGGDTYFGESARSATNTVESLIHYTVDPREFPRLKKHDARSFKLNDVLTAPQIEGYRTAIMNFIVGGCIQTINGTAKGIKPKKLRYCFLLHTETAKESHAWQEKLTNKIIEKLNDASKEKSALFTELVTLSYNDLSRSLALACQPVPPFNDVLESARKAVEENITITKVNSDEEVATLLDDTGQLKLRTPLNIFIGGGTFDRGVTLSNFIGFYYGRRPNKFQQDTVLQHSRMYGYRQNDLAITRFYTSNVIRHAMTEMEEFDVSLRSAIEAGGDRAVQFIRMAADGSIVPCSPNKILVATTQTLRPHKRILPFGFQTGYATGANGIEKIVNAIDTEVENLCGFNSKEPVLVPLATALELLKQIEPTMHFDEEDSPSFDWDSARAGLTHLSQQHSNPAERGKVLLWAARGRDSARFATVGSHATYVETPDSAKTEGKIAKAYAKDYPILFLLRQNGKKENDWRDTPFYWPVIRAQAETPIAIYTAETIKEDDDGSDATESPPGKRQVIEPKKIELSEYEQKVREELVGVSALSIRQPYAEQILLGKKKIEYRSTVTKKFERVAIYASKTAEAGGEDLPKEVLVGTVEITGCKERNGQYEWLLAKPERFDEPIKPEKKAQPKFFFPFG